MNLVIDFFFLDSNSLLFNNNWIISFFKMECFVEFSLSNRCMHNTLILQIFLNSAKKLTKVWKKTKTTSTTKTQEYLMNNS